MQRKTRKIIGAVALIGALAAGGAAFTAGSPIADQTQSYSSAKITGANASNLTFAYSPDGAYVTTATVTLVGNESSVSSGPGLATGPNAPYTITAGFTGTGPAAGVPFGTANGTPNSADDRGSTCDPATAIWDGVTPGTTTVVCDFTSSGPGDSVLGDAGYSPGNGYFTQQSTQFNLLVTGVNIDTTTGTP